MPKKVVTIKSEFSRRIPDPVFRNRQTERLICFCKANSLSPDFPKDPNPRRQNIDRSIYRDVAKSLTNELGTPGTFHLKNKGITIIADKVHELEEKGSYAIIMKDGQGIVDGAHTYEIIKKAIDDNECPAEQYIRIEVLIGFDEELIPEIAGGLNTAMQVQRMSLSHLEGKFDWIKEALKSTKFSNRIAYRENEKRNADVRDVVALLTLFNVKLYPNDKNDYPLKTYTSKAHTLEQYLKNIPVFENMMSSILIDILTLHDLVHKEARKQHNKMGGRTGKLAFVKSRKRGEFELPFTGDNSKHMLFDGALYPMLSAFKWMVVIDEDSNVMKWRGDEGFKGVCNLLKEIAAELMQSTKDKSDALGRNPNAIGKDRGHWENLFKTVALRQMQK